MKPLTIPEAWPPGPALGRLLRLGGVALWLAGTILGQAAEPPRVLVFSRTLLYRHASITNGVAAIRQLGAGNGFSVDATEDASAFTPTNLARYSAVVFLSTSGDVLNDTQQEALRRYLEAGGGLAGVHAAIAGKVATEGDWPWYASLCGTEFANHKAIERATVRIEEPRHPSTAHLPALWSRVDEWYNFTVSPRSRVAVDGRVLATLDEASFHGGTMGGDHPVAWTRAIGRGRFWYTALGHTEASYSEPQFLQHLLGGIRVAAGLEAVPAPPAPRNADAAGASRPVEAARSPSDSSSGPGVRPTAGTGPS